LAVATYRLEGGIVHSWARHVRILAQFVLIGLIDLVVVVPGANPKREHVGSVFAHGRAGLDIKIRGKCVSARRWRVYNNI